MMHEYELYHHGIKGQKWGVRRYQQLQSRTKARKEANVKKRNDRAEQAINRAGDKRQAIVNRAVKGALQQVGKNWMTSKAALYTMSIAMNAVSPPTAAVYFAATTAIALADVGLTVNNVYRTGRDIHDIAKHEDYSDYLVHHGIKGQRWGIRRFQDESGALTGLGKQRANLDTDWHPQKPASSGDFMKDLHNDIAAVNHDGGSYELGRGTNCLYCTTAYEMRRRGYDVQAQQDWVGGIRGDMPSAMFKGANTELVYDISSIPSSSPERLAYSEKATQSLIETIEAQGDGARGYIGVQWMDNQGGHSMAYEVINGKMHLIDCQTGDDLYGEDIWTDRMAYANSCTVTRVDNCEFDKDMVDRYIKDAGTEDSNDVMDEVLDQLFERLKKKRKKKKKSSSKKQINRYGEKLNSMWNSTKRETSARSRSFTKKLMGVI